MQGFSIIRAMSVFAFLAGSIGNAHGVTLGNSVEAVVVANVGATFQTVTLENTYSNAIPVCTYTLQSASNPPAAVRINNITSNSFQVRIQQFGASNVVTPGTVSCLVADEGVSTLADGRRIEARTVLSDRTHGLSAEAGFNNASIATMENVSGLFSGFVSPIALGQVISFSDPRASVFHANDCDNRGNPAFLSGFNDGICVTKHIGQISGSRFNETLGMIVIERGTGTANDIAYEAQLGPNTVEGVGNNPPYNYALAGNATFAVATLSGENGGQGGWAVTFGNAPVTGSTLGLAIEEEVVAGDATRSHIDEQVAYFVFRVLPEFTVSKVVDRVSIAETLTLNYEITIENTGRIDQTGVTIDDTLPDGSTGTVSGPTESLNADGVFQVGETWTYSVSYSVTSADLLAGVDLVNNVSVSTDQYVSEGFADETSLATTSVVPPAPSITVTKTADDDTNVPAGVTVTYTYVVANTGNQSISNISLADAHGGSGPAPVPGNEALTLDAGINGDSSDATANDGIWDSLAPGDEVTFTATYIVTQNDVDTLQ